MITAQQVLTRALSARGHAILYWIGQGGRDPGAALPSNPVRVAQAWASLDAADQQALAPLAQAMGIDVHDPALVRDACDCSGFVCWALGFARVLPGAGGDAWINTDSIWADAKGPQRRFEEIARARPGALVVYPKQGSDERYGHVAVVVEADADGHATRIIHCSADNIKNEPHDSIKITSADKFTAQQNSIYAWCRGVE
ncbi:CHAP domain-containing protein [Duganella sp. CF517]|uniref:CHAP domain-containing protein n=1 Tax=Duganella sp. CF517 TaxID=1881038 RepID=UPI0008B2ACBD|nr:CHAP domain-containing protein [Duganella sp. CF517]SEN82610.1 CHAP domain-containing protein [Duganella sp. CF517]